MKPPEYFESVRARAARRWEQLERDPELAGPWHQLFKQVQSPRHVVSELLQNADDAGATAASVSILDDEFVFAHNGDDFTEEHFASLCRFGYSNKRALHTIGFRGIGFKSTFSLGDEVQLCTPTLAIRFHRDRFTQPEWLRNTSASGTDTRVRVAIKDEHRKKELEKNLKEWIKSPASLLFFRHIRSLRIGDDEVSWQCSGRGPIPSSEWMALSTCPDDEYLLIRSEPEQFPDDALEEIRQERMLSVDEDTPLPPSHIEIVLGLEGRLYVILPTGVTSALPFACNAPFIQDPARVKIKDPETSPTNRWLLSRAGRLAASAMMAWLSNQSANLADRCRAYQLVPDVDRDDDSLEGTCATISEESFQEAIENTVFLLSDEGDLRPWRGCTSVPEQLLDIWSAEQVVALFGDDEQLVLCRKIQEEDVQKLENWDCIEKVDAEQVIRTLESDHLPRPDSWRKLLQLWTFVSEHVTSPYRYRQHLSVRIVPVQGADVLYAAKEVVRLGEKKLLQSEDDWKFLSSYLLVLNQNWTRYLAEQRRRAEENDDDELREQVEAAYAVLETLKLTEASDVTRVIEQVSQGVFAEDDCELEDCVRLAQLAATLGAAVPRGFQYVTRDCFRTPISDVIVVDEQGDLDYYLPANWHEDHVLDEAYTQRFTSCDEDEWWQWVRSGRSGLLVFPPLRQSQHDIWGRHSLRETLCERGCNSEPYYPYKPNQFRIDDWDFDDALWKHWRDWAKEDESYWGALFTRILQLPSSFWSRATNARALQVATTGSTQRVTHEPLLSAWIMKFRSLPCLPDTRGRYRLPAELLRRTPDTESLLDVEPFVRAEFDTEATRPLLDLLGVGSRPTGPDRLLDRLRALASVDDPPVYEVEKWYHRLDQLIDKCSTDESEEIRQAFTDEKIILTEDGEWAKAAEVFLAADDEDVPDVALVHAAVRHLALWHRVGVADRPTAERIMDWLADLPSGESLEPDELRRVRSLLPRYPERIWTECDHWLNLEGEWTPVGDLSYSLTMQSLVAWKHLFRPIKQKTADFQKLSADVCQQHPFSQLRRLADCIEDRFQEQVFGLPEPTTKPWLIALGNGLRRVKLDDEEETQRVRELASQLVTTGWQVATGLETVPYVDGTPAGTPRRIDVLWKGALLYVEDRSAAKMARAVALELGRVFGRQEVTDAIKLCYDRSPDFVTEYLEENFTLVSAAEAGPLERPAEALAGATSVVTDGALTEVKRGEFNANDPIAMFEALLNASSGDDNVDEVEQAEESSSLACDDNGITAVDEDDFDAELDDEPQPPPKPKPSKPAKPPLIERFARCGGYLKDGDDRFYHPNGAWIERVSGHAFPWERRSASGELLRCYWLKDHCIQREPLQLDAEVWELCKNQPEKYALLLVNGDGAPFEITGSRLKAMCDGGELLLYPAKYRLVYGEGTSPDV